MRQGLVRACHDCSEGGLAVAAAEMCIAGRLGMDVDLRRGVSRDAPTPAFVGVDTDDVALFAESNCRFLVEVAAGNAPAFEKVMVGHARARLGHVTEDGVMRVRGLRGQAIVECSVEGVRRAWQSAEVV